MLCGANNEDKDPPAILSKDYFPVFHFFRIRFNNPNTSVSGFLPRDECFSFNRVIVDEINELPLFKCSVNNFHLKDQSNGWTLNNGTLDFSLFHSDDLHLVEKGNLEFGLSILKAIDSTIAGSRISNRHKNAVCSTDFNLNLKDFFTLPRIVPVRNSVSFSIFIIKVESSSSVCPGKRNVEQCSTK